MRIGISRLRDEIQKCNEKNEDRGNEFEIVLKINDTRQLGFERVKEHATKSHIDRDVSITLNKGDNDVADALTSAAATHHVDTQLLTDATYEKQRAALITHNFASQILLRRRAAFLALHEVDHD